MGPWASIPLTPRMGSVGLAGGATWCGHLKAVVGDEGALQGVAVAGIIPPATIRYPRGAGSSAELSDGKTEVDGAPAAVVDSDRTAPGRGSRDGGDGSGRYAWCMKSHWAMEERPRGCTQRGVQRVS